jgi:hypothetical protein
LKLKYRRLKIALSTLRPEANHARHVNDFLDLVINYAKITLSISTNQTSKPVFILPFPSRFSLILTTQATPFEL